MVLRRILTCRGRLPRANRSYGPKWRTANQIAERPLVSQSRGRATNSLWGRDWPKWGRDLAKIFSLCFLVSECAWFVPLSCMQVPSASTMHVLVSQHTAQYLTRKSSFGLKTHIIITMKQYWPNNNIPIIFMYLALAFSIFSHK